MAGECEARLAGLGLVLPVAAAPAGAYVPTTRSGSLLIVSGQLPLAGGKPAFLGLVGAGVTIEQGGEAARLCALNILAQVKAALGDLDLVSRVLRVGGFVACPSGFVDQPKVVNGASELMLAVFGEAGRHARAAVGVASLPLGVPVEVEAMFEVKG